MQSVQVQTTVVDVVLRNMLQASMSYMQVKTSVADVLLRNTLQGSMQSRDAVWPLVSFLHQDQHCKRVRRSFSEFFWSFRSNRVSRFLFGQILRKCFELISRRCLATRLLATAGSTPWISFEINLVKKDFSWGRHCEYLFSWKDWAQRKQWSWGLQWIWCTI